MYAFIWRLLPGDRRVKAAIAAGLVLLAALILWYVVFPLVEPNLQFDHGVMNGDAPTTPAPRPSGH
ncbi:hypothetical protein AB0J52_32625 [Spirillospora sp. NPDC049652]